MREFRLPCAKDGPSRLTVSAPAPISRRLRRTPSTGAAPPPAVRVPRSPETDREAHLSTVEAGPQAPARLPRPHGDRRRPQGAGQPPRQGPQAPVRLSGRAATPLHARSIASMGSIDRGHWRSLGPTKPQRLKRRAEFLRVAAKGRKAPMPGLVLQALHARRCGARAAGLHRDQEGRQRGGAQPHPPAAEGGRAAAAGGAAGDRRRPGADRARRHAPARFPRPAGRHCAARSSRPGVTQTRRDMSAGGELGVGAGARLSVDAASGDRRQLPLLPELQRLCDRGVAGRTARCAAAAWRRGASCAATLVRRRLRSGARRAAPRLRHQCVRRKER